MENCALKRAGMVRAGTNISMEWSYERYLELKVGMHGIPPLQG